MIAVLLNTLFLGAACLAAGSIAVSLRRYGPAALALRAELAACPQHRELRVRLRETRMRPSATVLRPAFTATGQAASHRPARASALPVAA
ncbi:MAG: hypothetical protein WCY29_11950 [Novosphingobium sp.]